MDTMSENDVRLNMNAGPQEPFHVRFSGTSGGQHTDADGGETERSFDDQELQEIAMRRATAHNVILKPSAHMFTIQ
jgi:hypothetical protein